MTELKDFYNTLPDDKPVRAFLPFKETEDRKIFQCIFKKMGDSHFQLLFPPGSLPTDRLDMNSSCLVNLDIGGQSASIECRIARIINQQTLEMVPQKTVSHEQMREYFRVYCTVPIMIGSSVPQEFSTNEENWKITGTTVDLSGAGLRANLPQDPPEKQQVKIELALPGIESNIVKTLASSVRVTKITDKIWDVAYQFDVIEDEDQDAIIAYCLYEQRRLLRLKVKST